MKSHIIMADIIKSSDHNGSELMSAFKNIVKQVNDQMANEIISPLTITLGDEFQGVVKSLPAGINLVFQFDRLLLEKDFNLRFVLNYGEIETAINQDNAYGMLGEGLTLAREQLETVKNGDNRFSINGYNEEIVSLLNKGFKLYDYFYSQWTTKERMIVSEFLKGKDYKEVAKIFEKDISTMWRKEKSLNIAEYNTAKEMIQIIGKNAA
ncbi:hypothetical protein JKA74_04675 [Marivirga sp. S37H4]|uniref:SatD family (SatD) n=1 Tax=Marivirga aurantiaca TaxID=2802615 RepID=A0A934WWP9_9BACT|nr:SatD family protein [Marivirga aurantiaca]MBK6264321.1 hypothetical protein [Marivirga aurantiaca]